MEKAGLDLNSLSPAGYGEAGNECFGSYAKEHSESAFPLKIFPLGRLDASPQLP